MLASVSGASPNLPRGLGSHIANRLPTQVRQHSHFMVLGYRTLAFCFVPSFGPLGFTQFLRTPPAAILAKVRKVALRVVCQISVASAPVHFFILSF